MADEHPSRELLELFLGDELPPIERREIVRHLLTGCPRCTDATREIWAAAGGPEPGRIGRRHRAEPSAPAEDAAQPTSHPASYRGVVERAAERGRRRERELREERAAAPGLATRLLRAPAGRRRAMIERDHRLATCGLADLLLTRSGEADEPAHGVELAELALAVAERLDRERCGATVASEVVLRAWAALGEARRRGGDLEGAERALAAAQAQLRLAAAGGDAEDPAGERAELLVLAGALARDRGRLAAAAPFLARAVAAARSTEEPRLLARALLTRGLALAAAGGGEEAVEALREGTELAAEIETPSGGNLAGGRLLAAGLDRLVELLAAQGRGAEAARDLERLRPLAGRLGAVGGARLDWLAAKVALAGERPAAGSDPHPAARSEEVERAASAEEALLAARDAYLGLGRGREAALVSLDLALLYLRHRRAPDLRGLGGELYPIFAARDLPREALMALVVFRRAAESATVSAELLSELERYLCGFAPAARAA